MKGCNCGVCVLSASPPKKLPPTSHNSQGKAMLHKARPTSDVWRVVALDGPAVVRDDGWQVGARHSCPPEARHTVGGSGAGVGAAQADDLRNARAAICAAQRKGHVNLATSCMPAALISASNRVSAHLSNRSSRSHPAQSRRPQLPAPHQQPQGRRCGPQSPLAPAQWGSPGQRWGGAPRQSAPSWRCAAAPRLHTENTHGCSTGGQAVGGRGEGEQARRLEQWGRPEG